jgi:hypothetical protein
MRVLLAVLVVAITSIPARDSTVKIGEWRGGGGSLDFAIVNDASGRHIQVFASDPQIVDTILYTLNANDARRLQKILAETLNELEHPGK